MLGSKEIKEGVEDFRDSREMWIPVARAGMLAVVFVDAVCIVLAHALTERQHGC